MTGEFQQKKERMQGGILCVTNSVLCREPFLHRLERLAAAGPSAIILREKTLSEAAYDHLAEQAIQICKKYDTTLVMHSFYQAALKRRHPALHVPLPILRQMSEEQRSSFSILGASCHSVEEAVLAQTLGCTYVTAGHIFPTACKEGLPGRGLQFLKEVCQAVEIPVFGIGGINGERLESVLGNGAAGACVMNAFMTCQDPEKMISHMEELYEQYKG